METLNWQKGEVKTMAVTETETIGWGQRLGGSIKGVVAGLALFIGGFPVLFPTLPLR